MRFLAPLIAPRDVMGGVGGGIGCTCSPNEDSKSSLPGCGAQREGNIGMTYILIFFIVFA